MHLPPPAARERLFHGGGRCVLRGFTLIEIMLVIGIIAICFGVGIPAFVQSRKQAPLQLAATAVLEACNQARAQAILRDAPTELVFTADDTVNMHVEMSAAAPATVSDPSAPAPAPVHYAGGGLYSGSIPTMVTVRMLDVNFQDKLKEEQARIHFYPGGTSDEFTIVLQGAAGETYKISLDVMTALAEMEEVK